MRKKIAGYMEIMALALGAGCACGSEAAVSEDFKKVVDEYAQITLRMDAESALVDTAYEAMEEYLENQNLDQLEETAGEVEDAFFQLYEKYEQCKDYEIPDEVLGLLEEYDILSEDFQAYAAEEATQIYEYIQDLSNLHEYLQYEATDLPMTEEMAFHYEMLSNYQDINRNYMYTSINYWFAGRSEAEVAYVNEAVTDKLVSFRPDGHEWDDIQANVEDRLNAYLDDLADLRLDWEIHKGEREAENNRMKQELEELGTEAAETEVQ